MSTYYKPWLARREPDKPPPPEHPLDKVRCVNGQFRYVVACMHNCPRPRFCLNFWAFFESRDILPPDYYDVGGVGEQAMRRIVIDCDRCGKRDIDEVKALYRPEGEGDEFRRSDDELRQMVEGCGYAWDELGALVVHTLEHMEAERGWVHYCNRCFSQTVDWLAKIAQVKPNPALKSAATARDGEPSGNKKTTKKKKTPGRPPRGARTKSGRDKTGDVELIAANG